MNAPTIAAVLSLVFSGAPQTVSPDAEGFIRTWLVLAPIAIEGESGAEEIDRGFLTGEATMTPRAGDKVKVGARNWSGGHTRPPTPSSISWRPSARRAGSTSRATRSRSRPPAHRASAVDPMQALRD